MRVVRPLLLAVLIVGGFFYFTTYRNGHLQPATWMSQPAKVEITEAATTSDILDAEEQNNIGVYRRNIASVVNITSRAMAYDFFYGLVPQEGQGTGFIIDKEGHIITNYHVIAEARQVEVNPQQPEEISRHHRRHRPPTRSSHRPDQSAGPSTHDARGLHSPSGRPESLCHR